MLHLIILLKRFLRYNLTVTLNFFKNLLLPKLCAGCLRPGIFLCPHCRKKIIFTKIPLCPICEKPSPHYLTHPGCKNNYSIDGLYVPGNFTGVLKNMIYLLKYKNCREIANILVQNLFIDPPVWIKEINTLIPIPLHFKRLNERGYNQSELIVKEVSLLYKIPYKENLLRRLRYTKPQMSISNEKERKNNLKGVFAANTAINLPNIIGIVDDVATTGATIFEAAKILKQNGVKKVYGIVIARKN